MKSKSTAFRLLASAFAVFTSLGVTAEPLSPKSEAAMRVSFGMLVPIERTAIFPSEKAADFIRAVCYHPPAVTGYWTPEAKKLESVENTLVDYLASHKVEEKKDWNQYRRQIVGMKRGDERLLFIYYFHFDRGIEEDLKSRRTDGYDPESWKKRPHLAFDGGSWYFRVLYDLKTKRFVWYESNGHA